MRLHYHRQPVLNTSKERVYVIGCHADPVQVEEFTGTGNVRNLEIKELLLTAKDSIVLKPYRSKFKILGKRVKSRTCVEPEGRP